MLITGNSYIPSVDTFSPKRRTNIKIHKDSAIVLFIIKLYTIECKIEFALYFNSSFKNDMVPLGTAYSKPFKLWTDEMGQLSVWIPAVLAHLYQLLINMPIS